MAFFMARAHDGGCGGGGCDAGWHLPILSVLIR